MSDPTGEYVLGHNHGVANPGGRRPTTANESDLGDLPEKVEELRRKVEDLREQVGDRGSGGSTPPPASNPRENGEPENVDEEIVGRTGALNQLDESHDPPDVDGDPAGWVRLSGALNVMDAAEDDDGCVSRHGQADGADEPADEELVANAGVLDDL